jgi:hypothetical protein
MHKKRVVFLSLVRISAFDFEATHVRDIGIGSSLIRRVLHIPQQGQGEERLK